MPEPESVSVDLLAAITAANLDPSHALYLAAIGETDPDEFNRRLALSSLVEWAVGEIGVPSQEAAEAGDGSTPYLWTTERVAQAIAALTPPAEENPPEVSQGEAEAGTETEPRTWSPLRVAQAIAALAAEPRQHQLDGDGPPTATDDETEGYSVLSVWIDTTASPNETYKLVDPTADAAVWIKTSLTADELATVALSGLYSDLSGRPALPSQEEAEAGTATTERVWSAQRVAQAVAALSPAQLRVVGVVSFSGSDLTKATYARRIVYVDNDPVRLPPQSEQAFEAGDFFWIYNAAQISRGEDVELLGPGGTGVDYQPPAGAWTLVVRIATDEWAVACVARPPYDIPSQAAMETGTSTTPGTMTPQRVAQAIAARAALASYSPGTAGHWPATGPTTIGGALNGLAGRGIAKVTWRSFAPSSAQTLADTYADVDGSDMSVTPTRYC